MLGEAKDLAGEDQASQVHFVFEDGEMTFSLPPELVSEVSAHAWPTPVPFTPDWVDGVLSVRGQIVPVLDLGAFFGTAARKGASGRETKRRVLVIDNQEYQFAVWADHIHGVETVFTEQIEEPLESIPKEMLACSASQFRLDERLVIALDLDRLVERTRSQVRRT